MKMILYILLSTMHISKYRCELCNQSIFTRAIVIRICVKVFFVQSSLRFTELQKQFNSFCVHVLLGRLLFESTHRCCRRKIKLNLIHQKNRYSDSTFTSKQWFNAGTCFDVITLFRY